MKLKKLPTYVTYVDKTACKLINFTRNCGSKNLDDSEGDENDTYLWRA